MKTLINVILGIVLLNQTILAQPAVAWLKEFDNGGDEYFYDIYNPDEGFVLCGTASGLVWGVRTDDDGD